MTFINNAVRYAHSSRKNHVLRNFSEGELIPHSHHLQLLKTLYLDTFWDGELVVGHGGFVIKRVSSIGDFDALYRYIQLRLNDATLERSVEPLDEITTLVTPIKDAWLNIPQAEKMKVEAMREQIRGA